MTTSTTERSAKVLQETPVPIPEVEAAAKALAIHDGWTELGWERITSRYSERYYNLAQVALGAAQPVFLDRVRAQQARLDAVDELTRKFIMKPTNAPDSIEQPAFGRGIRAAGREIRAALGDPS